MTITKIETQKNNKEKVNVFVDDKYSFSVTMNGLLDFGLNKGDEITTEKIEEIKKKDSPSLAVMQAVNIISYSQRTEKELEKKLKEKKFNDDAIAYAIEKMKSYGYIDDESYVSSYITSKAIPNGWGEQKIISMLLQKGIEMDLIKQKLEEHFSDDVKKESVIEVAKKYASRLAKYDDKKKKQKLYQHLASKGFRYEEISYACRNVLEDNSEEDEYY